MAFIFIKKMKSQVNLMIRYIFKGVLNLFFWIIFATTNVAITANAAVCDLPSSGVGGTGHSGESSGGSGVGGTGHSGDSSEDSGVGGTGVIYRHGSGTGGTGSPLNMDGQVSKTSDNGSGVGGIGLNPDTPLDIVVGKITGFASICVNGVEIHYAKSTPVDIEGKGVSATSDLRIGQTVIAHVSGMGNEVNANTINVVYPVIGPVSGLNIDNGRIEVLGQPVVLSSDLIPHIKNVKLGEFVRVSGFAKSNGDIIATRVDVSKPVTPIVKGVVTQINENSFKINNLTIESNDVAAVTVGSRVQISGNPTGVGRTLVEPIVQENSGLVLNAGVAISVEGFVSANSQNPSIIVGGQQIPISQSLAGVGSVPVIVRGEIGDKGGININTIVPLVLNHGVPRVGSRFVKTEVEEVEVPEIEEVEEVEEVEVPEIEEVEEVEVPEIEEVEEVEVPEVELPEIEEVEVPEIEEVEVPEIEEVELPEIEEVELPET